MSQLLLPNHTFMPGATLGPDAALDEARAGLSGTVSYDRVGAFAHMKGLQVQCDSGHLWVTLENDPVDHVLLPRQGLTVAADGKVVIGGKGVFSIRRAGGSARSLHGEDPGVARPGRH